MFCDDLQPRIYESLKTLCCLANAAGPVHAHDIASASGLPPAQTAKILQMMTWAGFIESRRGTKGGYWLVKPAARIRVTEVVAFFARPVQVDHRKDPILRALARVTVPCRKQFNRITIADLSKLSACKTFHGPVTHHSKV